MCDGGLTGHYDTVDSTGSMSRVKVLVSEKMVFPRRYDGGARPRLTKSKKQTWIDAKRTPDTNTPIETGVVLGN
eukprot:g43472.t1